MEAGKRTVRDIFNRGRNLEIPFFQRSYVWGEEQWERFLDDMKTISTSKKPYFLGSVILKQQNTTSDKDSILTVIDGQQRLTTLNIFMKVLCLKKNTDTEFIETFKKQRDKTIILLHNHNDLQSFNEIVNLDKLEDYVENRTKTNNINGAFQYFKDNISDEDLNENLNFFNILDNILFVGIDLNQEEDEQQIFDTINSLGVRLTTAELLKNHFFQRDELFDYNEYWKEVFEKDEENKNYWDQEITTGRLRRTFIDLFFYSFLQIKMQDTALKVKTEDKLEFSKVEALFESYKKFHKDYGLDKELLLKEIKEYAIIFKNNFDYNVIKKELTHESGIERINAIIFGLETSTLIPYILFVLKNVEDQASKNEIFEFLESYIMRRIIVKATTKNYNQLFSDRLIYNKILNKEDLISFISERSDQINYFPSDQDLENGFNNSILINKQSAGVLYFLESKIRDRSRQATQLLGIRNYSLEHLMPKKWENNWDVSELKESKDFRNKKLLTLGNLTIITQNLNASIRDSNWETKKKGKGNNYGLSHFSGGIETLVPYLKHEKWTENEINERANFLYKKALEVWKNK